MRYHYIRIFALPRELPPLLVAAGKIRTGATREDFLAKVFGEQITFFHRKSMFVFLPLGFEGKVIMGRIGRSKTEFANRPPDQGFEEYELLTWRTANLLIDTSSHTDGQKVAMQKHPDVGAPFGVLESLVNHINETDRDGEYVLELATISDEGRFWGAVAEYKDSITSVEFTLITPNVLGLRSSLNEGLQDARDKNGAREVQVVLKNDEGGLKLEGEKNIEEAVEYVTKGGGRAKLKKGKEKIYDTKDKYKTAKVEDDEPLTPQKKGTWSRFVHMLFPEE